MNYRHFVKYYLVLHAAVSVLAILVLLTLRFPIFRVIGVCPIKTLFRIYCPFCGGTRAAGALLSGDILSSLRLYPILPVYIATVVYFEVYAVRTLVTRDLAIMKRVRLSVLFIPAAATLVFFVLRNIFLLCGVDPIGELIRFYTCVSLASSL